MRHAWIALLLLMCTSCSAATAGGPSCFPEAESLPGNWRPTAAVQQGLDPSPWSASEEAEAVFSIRKGVEEMAGLYERRPSAVEEIWEDSVASMIEVTYGGKNTPELDAAARDAARSNLSQLIQPYLKRTAESVDCADYGDMVPLAVYAHNQYEPHDARIEKMTGLTNAAWRACGSLQKAMGIDYQAVFDGTRTGNDEEVFDLVIWSLLFIENQTVPGLETTQESRDFPAALWRFLDTYPLRGAADFKDGAKDPDFIETAYLATHIAYVPTGNHRFPLYVEDSPRLHDYHRENFYAVLEMGELDLVAEFVDSLRQYGCTPENDVQVRDGTRYLLDVFHAGGDKWSAYREPGETDADVEDYDFIHKAWTGVLGVRDRAIEPADPGTYGGVVRSWLPAPQ